MAKMKINYETEAIVLHRNYIKKGDYLFKDSLRKDGSVALQICECGGMQIRFNNDPSRVLADENVMKLTTAYNLKCFIDVDEKTILMPTANTPHDWPRSSEGRLFLEEVFINHLNYFFDNMIYFSYNKNPNHHLLRSIKPIGSADIISIDFKLNGRSASSQGNSLLRLIVLGFEDDAFWPKTSNISKRFKNVAPESKLLSRAISLVHSGFYQEAILVSFSVLDSKLQDLVESRMNREYCIGKRETQSYLRNISQSRMSTILLFLFKCIDKTSIEDIAPDLYRNIDKLNRKRNSIIHAGESASRGEAQNAVIDVAKTLCYLNIHHKGAFDVPAMLVDDKKNWSLFL